MESSTGGWLANAITEVPSSSSYYKGGVVASSERMLTAIGVPAEILSQYGAASQEELRLLEMIRYKLDIDRLIAAGIERGDRARHMVA